MLIVGMVVFLVSLFRKDSTYEETQRNVAVSMYGVVPVVENDKPDIAEQLEKECARIEALIQAAEAGHGNSRVNESRLACLMCRSYCRQW